MRLILVRHGEAEHNIKQLMVGHGPSRLTTKGREQAKQLAERLSAEQIDAAFSSVSERAVGTARAILDFHPEVKLVIAPQLRERKMGEMEGKSREEFLQAAKESGVEWFEYKPLNGESMVETRNRAASFIQPLEKKYFGKTILVVSHRGFIRALVAHLLKENFDANPLRTNNASVTILGMDDHGNHRTHIVNDTSHLI